MLGDYLRNGRFLALSVALLIVAGLAALSSMPRTEDPRVTNRVALVLTSFPGATAERVESLVSEPIENELRQMSEISELSSTSRPGFSLVRIKLKDEISKTAEVWSRARDRVNDVQSQLPSGALPSRFDDDRGYAYTMQYALTWRGPGEIDLGTMRRYAKELQTRLRGVSGTDLVTIFGDQNEEVLVEIDPQRMATAGISAALVAETLQTADTKVSAGELNGNNNRLQVEVSGELESEERIRNVALRVDRDGETLRVGDIASVRRQVSSPPDEITLISAKPGMVVATRMLPDLRIDQWKTWVNEAVDDFESILSANIELQLIFDQSDYTSERLGGLVNNVLAGFIIIVLVLLFTMGLRAALVVALALPLTALFTLACMRFWGLPVHQMSVTGLVVALGIMVDNAIVMVDMIQQKRQQGKRALQAMAESIQHLWLPLLGSSLTTILAFSPIVLMPGPAGEFVGGIALSVIFSLIGSYLISHTIIAGFAGRFLKPCEQHQSTVLNQGISTPALSRWFSALLYSSLRHPLVAILMVSGISILGFASARLMTEQFFPPSDRDMFNIELKMPAQTSINATQGMVNKIYSYLESEAELESQHWFIGSNAPPFYYNMLQREDGSSNFAQGMIKVKDFKTANQLIPQLQITLDDQFPQAQILVRKLEQGPPFNAPLEIRLIGPNLDQLKLLGQQIKKVMLETQDVVHTKATLADAVPKIKVNTREEVSRQTGLELGEIARQLQNSLDGIQRGSLLEGTEELPVRIRIGEQQRSGLTDLADLYISSEATGVAENLNGMPVSAIASFTLEPSRGAIPRYNGERSNSIEGYLRAGVLPQTVLQRFQENLAASEFTLPAGYRMEIAGESSERNRAVSKLLSSVGIILILLILVVVLSFNSFRISGIIFSVAGLAAGLGILSVFLFGYPFGFTVIVGLLGLIGLAINASIVIIAELKADKKAVHGDIDAIVHGVMSCTRHITSTTITTLGGFMPLILEGGGFWPPFAICIAGGTVLTTSVSFFFAPAAFKLMADRRSFEQSGQGHSSWVQTLPKPQQVSANSLLRKSA